ncbi:MAG: JAB domain-containing protein [Deltaproteobacteria bacterium]|nr:JAB domain-containing protein [Deltaproteobacteria bacterium]
MIVSRERVSLPDEYAAMKLLSKILDREDPISKDREHFWVISLDAKNKVKFVELIGIGTVDNCLAHPREVFRRAIVSGAAKIIIGHNHPSGDSDPSPEDLEITQKLKQASEILSIPLLDHIIIGITHYSFKANNQI